MKKLVLMVAAVAAMTFVSCDNKKAENANGEATDSAAVAVAVSVDSVSSLVSSVGVSVIASVVLLSLVSFCGGDSCCPHPHNENASVSTKIDVSNFFISITPLKIFTICIITNR